MTNLLDSITSPGDLKSLHMEQLRDLARDIRERIISVVSRNGGHLASSLGAVEITIALHYVFDSPRDTIVWDVGHQAYAHKILTGRNNVFESLRKKGGISGFPRRAESEHDSFGTGHASTAVSAAMGILAVGESRNAGGKAIALIGDGSLTGGLCYEALNNASHTVKNLLVVLNDNEMSISPNVGAIPAYLNRIITSPIYNRVRQDVREIMRHLPAIGKRFIKPVRRLEESLKNLVAPGMLFEELGLRYLGPVNGHDIEALVHILRRIRQLRQPIILHVITRKGKGYRHAEEHPECFHGTSPFDITTGKALHPENGKSYTRNFGDIMLKRGQADDRVVAITAAMTQGTGLQRFAAAFPDRCYDVGIAEEHAVTFAAGLAAAGNIPVVALYATFLQRAYDQIIHDVCLQKLPVLFAVDRAGLVGADGATHSGQFAVSFLRHIPDLVVMAPADGRELQLMFEHALSSGVPVAILYPKSSTPPVPFAITDSPLSPGKAVIERTGPDLTIIALGAMLEDACSAADKLARKGKRATVINARFVKPLDHAAIAAAAAATGRLVTLEENALEGGFGSAVLESCAGNPALMAPLLRIGIPDSFVPHGSRDELKALLGLDAAGITKRICAHFWPDTN